MSANTQIEIPVIINPDLYFRALTLHERVAARQKKADRRARLIWNAEKREKPRTYCCESCVHGKHRACQQKRCGCVCSGEYRVLASA
jgi:hypothetical protein